MSKSVFHPSGEVDRLEGDPKSWRKWVPYFSERQWGTVREDYSPGGNACEYLPHDHSRSRAYRWGEDGIAGFSDHHLRLCLSLAMWNGRHPILKERLFGLTNSEGNHGEDCKELHYNLDATPTHSYLRMLYKYPQRRFHRYYGDDFKVECPTGAGAFLSISEVADELCRRLTQLFLRDRNGHRAVFHGNERLRTDPHFRDHVLFHEYFHGDTGRGVGASHQTGWTGLVANLLAR